MEKGLIVLIALLLIVVHFNSIILSIIFNATLMGLLLFIIWPSIVMYERDKI
jgi:hypothetical protein